MKTVSQPSLLKPKQIAVDGHLICLVISCLSKSREHGKQVSQLLLQTIQLSIKVCQLCRKGWIVFLSYENYQPCS